jgi:hypothetical protein
MGQTSRNQQQQQQQQQQDVQAEAVGAPALPRLLQGRPPPARGLPAAGAGVASQQQQQSRTHSWVKHCRQMMRWRHRLGLTQQHPGIAVEAPGGRQQLPRRLQRRVRAAGAAGALPQQLLLRRWSRLQVRSRLGKQPSLGPAEEPPALTKLLARGAEGLLGPEASRAAARRRQSLSQSPSLRLQAVGVSRLQRVGALASAQLFQQSRQRRGVALLLRNPGAAGDPMQRQAVQVLLVLPAKLGSAMHAGMLM